MFSRALKQAALLAILITTLIISAQSALATSRYDRELTLKDQTREDKVISVFKQLITAYEDEDAQGFLDLVSDDRFRQDYITFTDALYSDFRKYEIHQVDYWVQKVVPDHVKQFLFVRWEKRFEELEDGRQRTQKGLSRFLFDEVNGNYLLIELAGNPLFGESLKEWRDEMPAISGQEMKVTTSQNTVNKPIEPVCGPGDYSGCTESSCPMGQWYNGNCYASVQDACNAKGGTWEPIGCVEPHPDLDITEITYLQTQRPLLLSVHVKNIGNKISGNYTVTARGSQNKELSNTGFPLSPGQSDIVIIEDDFDEQAGYGDPSGDTLRSPIQVTVVQTSRTDEANTYNNSDTYYDTHE